MLLELEELLGRWDRIAELTRPAEELVDANLATPCVRNARSLFLCALASTYRADQAEASRLEARAEDLSFEGFGLTLDGPRIRLAMTRGDLEQIEELVAGRASSHAFYLGSQTALLDGLATIRDRERVEAEAEPLRLPGTYLEPFALRALGLRPLAVRAGDLRALNLRALAVRARDLLTGELRTGDIRPDDIGPFAFRARDLHQGRFIRDQRSHRPGAVVP